jgi:hypothetical protein
MHFEIINDSAISPSSTKKKMMMKNSTKKKMSCYSLNVYAFGFS